MVKKISKGEVKKELDYFFENIKDKSSKEVKKIKKLAMSHNIPLKEKRKLFCKKCLNPYSGKEKIRLKEGRKIVFCKSCDSVSRYKIQN